MKHKVDNITLVCCNTETKVPACFTYCGDTNQVVEIIKKCYREHPGYTVLLWKTGTAHIPMED